MKIQGYEVTADQERAGLHVMHGEFTASSVRSALVLAGVPTDDYVDSRVADALLRRERAAGRIAYKGGVWSRLGAA